MRLLRRTIGLRRITFMDAMLRRQILFALRMALHAAVAVNCPKPNPQPPPTSIFPSRSEQLMKGQTI
jgi:hypothetical protein